METSAQGAGVVEGDEIGKESRYSEEDIQTDMPAVEHCIQTLYSYKKKTRHPRAVRPQVVNP